MCYYLRVPKAKDHCCPLRQYTQTPTSHLYPPNLPRLAFLSMAVILLFTATVLIFRLLCKGKTLRLFYPELQTPPRVGKLQLGISFQSTCRAHHKAPLQQVHLLTPAQAWNEFSVRTSHSCPHLQG